MKRTLIESSNCFQSKNNNVNQTAAKYFLKHIMDSLNGRKGETEPQQRIWKILNG